MTFESDDPGNVVSARIDETTAERLNRLNTDKSEFIRYAIRKSLPESDSGIEPPDDELLADGYIHLVSISGKSGWVECDTAETQLSKRLGIAKETVRSSVIKPLSNRGYVQVYQGMEIVNYRVIQ